MAEDKEIEERIAPLLEDAMHKFLGVTIPEIKSDISDRLKKTALLQFDVSTSMPFKKAKRLFKKAYLVQILQKYLGNVSEVARIAGVDRRSVHRLASELKIKINQLRSELPPQEYMRQSAVKTIIEESLDTYKSSLNPDKFKQIYRQAPALSAEIVKELPERQLTLKEAELVFEKQYLTKAFEENNKSITRTAKKIGLRYETLQRKMSSLGIIRR